MIHIMGYHGLLANALCNQSIERGTITYRHLREVSTEDTRDVVSGIVFFPPIQILAILIEVLGALLERESKKVIPEVETQKRPEAPACACWNRSRGRCQAPQWLPTSLQQGCRNGFKMTHHFLLDTDRCRTYQKGRDREHRNTHHFATTTGI